MEDPRLGPWRARWAAAGGAAGAAAGPAPDPAATWGFVRPARRAPGGEEGGDAAGARGLLGELRWARIFWCPDCEEGMAAAYGVDLDAGLVGGTVRVGVPAKVWGLMLSELNVARACEGMQQGQALVAQGRLEEAILHFNHAVQCDPARADLFVARAEAEYKLGGGEGGERPQQLVQLKRASQDLQAAIELGWDPLTAQRNENVRAMLEGLIRAGETKGGLEFDREAITGPRGHGPLRADPSMGDSAEEEAPEVAAGEGMQAFAGGAGGEGRGEGGAPELPSALGGRDDRDPGGHRKRRRRKHRREHRHS